MDNYSERFERMMTDAYGPFVPGSIARAIRHENAAIGYRTCWHCIGAFKPRTERDASGRRHRLGRGRWYCSRACSDDARFAEMRRPVAALEDDGTLVLDLRRFDGAAA